ncbi:hypothetical protein IL306_009649 [Fusarium sp. DS 682]|nr:hypothetical protein IL306_009649 [Fusarium sp. DS 682]
MTSKHYLEYSPRHSPGTRFSGQVPTDKELKEYSNARRRHISQYIAFLRPEIGHMVSEYGRVAIQTVCEELYAINVRATPMRWFMLMCDRTMWRFCFTPLSSDGPEWPWSNITYPSNLVPGEQPSSEYAKYFWERKARDAELERINASFEAEAKAGASAAAANPNSKFIVTLKAPLHDIGDPEPVDDDYQRRIAIWEADMRKTFSECDAVGPFEIEPKVPLDWYVTKDLATINGFLPPGIAIKLNMTNKTVLVTAVDMISLKHVVEVWKFLRSWAMTTDGRFGSEPRTLLQHFQGFKDCGGFSWDT